MIDLKYNSDYSDVFTILENKQKTFINTLCFTQSIKHASLELGVSKKCIADFMGAENITGKHLSDMRKEFALSEKKVKLQFILIQNGTNTSYRKNPEIEE